MLGLEIQMRGESTLKGGYVQDGFHNEFIALMTCIVIFS